MLFWFVLVLFSLLTVILLCVPMSKFIDWQKNHRQQTNIALYQAQQTQHTELANEMAQRLLQDEQYNAQYRPLSAVRFRPIFACLLALLVLVASFAYYFTLPRYQQAQQGQQANRQQHATLAQSNSQQKNDIHLINVQNRLRQDPNNGETWYQLGQLYLFNNEFANAFESFRRAKILLGDKPYILGAMATVLYYQAGQKMTVQSQQFVQQALAQDPLDTASLSLLASEAFLNADYAQALTIWQQILDSGRSTVERRSIIQSMQMAEGLQRATQQ
ncbi:c-type cytochrome biogenesis protein [Volucribacter amazonae]|uniref:Cytochrome c-type biogenesis protein H TPR domain-containing protein n=1 Tax=Volucribacter amazonae TaxID=256731 RepID=A0A9X4PCA4_9PAST|nr:c-type cytochrome biogenesis protein [Volucribacter amazonae]MDG6894741.1 hypothetical protein [Volucribacter amazonae]